MCKIVRSLKKISSTAVAVSTIISMLGWISVQTYKMARSLNEAINIVPVVKKNTADIDNIKQTYILASIYNGDISEIQQKYILTEIDFMINETLTRIYKKQSLGRNYVNRLTFYKSNISFLTNQQINNIEYIEKVFADLERQKKITNTTDGIN